MKVVLDFMNCRIWDHSGNEAIQKRSERFSTRGSVIHNVQHRSKDFRELLDKAGSIVDVNVDDDPVYHLANLK